MVDFTRKITHQSYKNPEKLKKYYHRVEKKIYVKPRNSVNSNSHRLLKYDYKDNNFIYYHTRGTVVPLLGGGISFAFLLIFLFPLEEKRDEVEWAFLIITALVTIFFLIYGLTKPKKEHILNRKDGLITMTGFFWQKNITMPFKKVEFAYSTGGENMVGAFRLEVIRPNKWQTFDSFGYGGQSVMKACHLSHGIWIKTVHYLLEKLLIHIVSKTLKEEKLRGFLSLCTQVKYQRQRLLKNNK